LAAGALRAGVLLSALLAGSSLRAAAQGQVLTGAPPAVTLQQAVDEALRASPGLLAVQQEADAARKQIGVRRGQLYGELDVVASAQHYSYAQLLEPMQGPLTPAASAAAPFAQDQVHLGVVYTYPLYVAGRILNEVRIAELGAERARELLTGARSDVVYNVTALFVQAQALQAQVAAVQQEIDELEVTRKDLELAVKLGKRPEVDLLKVLDRISEAQAAHDGLNASRTRIVAALMALMGRRPNQPVTLASLPDRLPDLTTAETVLDKGAANRSTVRAAKLAADQTDRQVEVARALMEPNVALQATYLRHADASYLDQSKEYWYVGLQVGFPLFDAGSRRAGVLAAQRAAAAAKHRLETARLQSLSELQAALAAWQAARQQMAAANAQYDSAHEVARIEQLRYDTGAGDIEDLLRARTREVGAQTAQITARAQIIMSVAQINHVTESEVAR
jgi:outer membrane protein TolC